MTSFEALFQLAASTRGGVEVFEATLPVPKTSKQLMAQTDDRYLSMISGNPILNHWSD